MSQSIIEIHPKKAEFDPLAKQVRAQLIEYGEKPSHAVVETQRLYRIEGDFDHAALERIANTLLVDPVVETVFINVVHEKSKPKKKKLSGYVLDIWPKPGVTDPVGETVAKGLNDLGFQGHVKAATAIRYVFPKIKESSIVENLAKKVWANELIHDIHIRKN